MAAIAVAMALVVALLGVLVVGLLRSHAEILKALHDLGVNLEDGAPTRRRRAPTASRHAPARTAAGVAPPRSGDALEAAADLTGTLPRGGSARVAVVGVDHPTLLAFLSTGCGTCGAFWDALNEGVTRLPDPATRVVVVTNGPESESPAAVAELAPPDVVTIMSDEAWDDYGVPVSPFFALVDGPTGRVIGEGSGTSWDQVVDLLAKAVADSSADRSTAATRAERPLTRMRGQDRAERVDRELRAAGIEPGDPSLYPAPHPDHAGDTEDVSAP
jgi:hypothetical protein